MSAAIVKKKRVSRKNKAGWSKVDIADVENFQEEQRVEEIEGKLDDKPNEEIFIDDSKPQKVKLTARQARKLNATKPAKCFISLENTSKVSDPIKKRNLHRSSSDKMHPLNKVKALDRKAKGIIPEKKMKSLLAKIESAKKVTKVKVRKAVFDKDLWSTDDQHPKLAVQWYNPELKRHHLRNTGIPTVNVPKISHVKRSQLKAIETPIAGTSYNPKPEQLQELINEAVEKEEDLIKVKQSLKRILKPMFEPVSIKENKRRKREEMTMGFPVFEDSADDSPEDEADYKPLNPPVRNKKKDLQARRKQKEYRLRCAEQDRKKQELKKHKDLTTLRKFKKLINIEEEKVIEKQINRETLKLKAKYAPRRLAKTKFIEEDLPIPESMAAIGNLRTMVPEGDILIDRFKSLQKRNILAPNHKRAKKRRSLAKVKKPQFKELPKQPLTKKEKKAMQVVAKGLEPQIKI